MRRLLAAVGSAVLAVPGPAAPTPAVPAADALVDQLAADRYADREAAGYALVRLGSDALPALDRAAAAADPETRLRAARIAEQIRRADENRQLLAAPPVSFDYAGVPLAAAVADFRKATGIPVELAPDGVNDALRPVTAKAGPLPPWEALDRFCRSAGLREAFSADAPDLGRARLNRTEFRQNVWSTNYLADTPQVPPGAVPVLLADGKPEAVPGERSTAVRVLALPAGFPGNRSIRGAGDVLLHLDVAPLPGLRWDEATAVRVSRAEDETGRPVEPSYRPDAPASAVPIYGEQVFFGGGVIVGNAVVFDEHGGQRTAAKPNPRLVSVKLRTDDRAVRKLRVLEGSVLGEVSLPNQTLIEVPDMRGAVGTAHPGPADSKLTVLGYEVKPDGAVAVRLRAEGANPWTMQRLGRRNRFAVMNAMPVVPGEGIALVAGGLGQVKFHDAEGKPVRPPGVSSSSLSDDGFRQTQELELVFVKFTEAGPPVKLAVVGNKGVTVEVPFRLTDVPLP